MPKQGYSDRNLSFLEKKTTVRITLSRLRVYETNYDTFECDRSTFKRE